MTPEISGYQIRRELGKGGMGMVYLARRESDDVDVALKILPPNLLSPTTARRFQREGQALGALDHPNVVKVFEVGARKGYHFIAMEYVKGHPVSRLISQNPRGLPVEEALRIAIAVASALQTIHQQGMTHRDLKPGNVMVTDAGEVKLLDFGLVQVDGLTMLTATGNIIGTPSYMSPEQCSGDLLDSRSDIYSFGILLYELLCGEPPFQCESVYELLEHQRKAPPPSLRAIRKDVPALVEQLVLQCLEKRPDDRIQTLALFLERIGSDQQHSAAIAAPAGGSSVFRRRSTWTVAATVLLGAVAFTGFSDLPQAHAVRHQVRDWLNDLRPETDLREQVQLEYQNLSQAEALAAQGRSHQSKSEWQEAYDYYRRAAQTYRKKPHYLHALITLSRRANRESDARQLVRRYLSRGGDDPGRILQRWVEGS